MHLSLLLSQEEGDNEPAVCLSFTSTTGSLSLSRCLVLSHVVQDLGSCSSIFIW